MKSICLVGVLALAGALANAQTPQEFLYSVQYPGGISAFFIDLKKGNVSPVPGSPFASGAHTGAAAVSPSGQFLYVTAATKGRQVLRVFGIDPGTGALAQIPGSPFRSEPNSGITIDATGRFFYMSVGAGISAFTIDANLGSLTPAGPPIAAGDGVQVVADPNGPYVFTNGPINAYLIDPTSGRLTLASGTTICGSYVVPNSEGNRIYAKCDGAHECAFLRLC